jgi:hypothetical protein
MTEDQLEQETLGWLTEATVTAWTLRRTAPRQNAATTARCCWWADCGRQSTD